MDQKTVRTPLKPAHLVLHPLSHVYLPEESYARDLQAHFMVYGKPLDFFRFRAFMCKESLGVTFFSVCACVDKFWEIVYDELLA